jgi:hypothetical protein
MGLLGPIGMIGMGIGGMKAAFDHDKEVSRRETAVVSSMVSPSELTNMSRAEISSMAASAGAQGMSMGDRATSQAIGDDMAGRSTTSNEEARALGFAQDPSEISVEQASRLASISTQAAMQSRARKSRTAFMRGFDTLSSFRSSIDPGFSVNSMMGQAVVDGVPQGWDTVDPGEDLGKATQNEADRTDAANFAGKTGHNAEGYGPQGRDFSDYQGTPGYSSFSGDFDATGLGSEDGSFGGASIGPGVGDNFAGDFSDVQSGAFGGTGGCSSDGTGVGGCGGCGSGNTDGTGSDTGTDSGGAGGGNAGGAGAGSDGSAGGTGGCGQSDGAEGAGCF